MGKKTNKKTTTKKKNHNIYKNIINIPTFHYNFYSEDDELFSIDHKYPISKGGSKYSVDNIQPMIMLENFKKENKLIFI